MKQAKYDVPQKNMVQTTAPANFIRQILEEDLKAGKNEVRASDLIGKTWHTISNGINTSTSR